MKFKATFCASTVTVTTLSCMISCGTLFAQVSPGGVGTGNLTAWFRADDVPVGNVTSWSTTFPSGPAAVTVTDAQAPYPQLEITPTGAVSNYNRTLHFSGNSYLGQNTANLQGLSLTPAPNLLDNAYTSNQGSFFSAYYLPQPPSSNGHLLLYNEGNDAIQCRNLNNSGRIALGLLSVNSVNASRDWTEDFRPNIISYKGNRSTAGSMNGYTKGALLPTPSVASQSSGTNGLYIGYSPTIGTSAYNGYLHEFVFFNRDLSALEMKKVHTYLAVKYGVTLSNNGGGTNGDYVATDGTTIWVAADQPQYHNDVIGIGRDDAEELDQRQSHTFDDSCRIYLNNLMPSNEQNTGSFVSNVSYLVMGHNTDRLCGTVASTVEVPVGITSRLAREFKCTKTNMNQVFNWDVRIDTCSSFSAGVIPENLRLLVDTDGDFTDAEVFDASSGLTFTIVNDVITVSEISGTHVPDNATRFLTIGYVDVSYTVSGEDPLCNGNPGWVVFEVFNTTNPVTINYSDGTNALVLGGVQDGDTLYTDPSQTVTYTFDPLPRPFNCCNVPAGISTSLTVTQPDPLTLNVSNDTTICENGTVSLLANASEPNCLYYWDFTADPGALQTDAPQADASYEVYAENANGCVSSVEIINAFVRPPLSGQNSPDITICPGYPETITITNIDGGLAPYTISWSSGEQGTGTTMSIEANPPVTTMYEVTVTDACESTPLIANINVTVAPLPVPLFTTPDRSICEPAQFTLINTTDPNMVQSLAWILSDGQFFLDQESVTTAAMPEGSYDVQLIVTSPQGCIDSVSYEDYLTVYPLPVAQFVWSPNPVQMFNPEVSFQNQSQQGTDFEWWFDGAEEGISTVEHPTVSFPDGETGDYDVTLIVTSEYGCMDTITRIVQVVPEVLIYVPNTFTPDNDEFNQRWHFYLEGIDAFDFDLRVYNRWGELVWESRDPTAGWDGTYHGQLVPAGTYSWIIEAGDGMNDNKYVWNGHVNVLD